MGAGKPGPTDKPKTMKPTDLPAPEFIKYLNARKGWHGKQYRTICGQWLQKHLNPPPVSDFTNQGVLLAKQNPRPTDNRETP